MAKSLKHLSGVGPGQNTPSSLAFLIRQRAIVSGQIERLEQRLLEIPKELAVRQGELSAIDLVLGRHRVKVDPEKIKPKGRNAAKLVPYGHMKRFLIEGLKKANGQPVPTTELVFALMIHYELARDSDTTEQARYAILKGLKNLKDDGIAVRHDSSGKHREGLWSLASKEQLARRAKRA